MLTLIFKFNVPLRHCHGHLTLAQTAEVERERNRVKKINERRKAKKAAAVTKGSSSTTPSRGRQTKARNSNTNSNMISPAPDKGKRKAPVQTPPTKNASSSGKEEGTSMAKPETPPRSTLVEHGSASRPTVPLEHGGLAVKMVAVASEELSNKTPKRRLLTMPTRSNPRTPPLEQGPSESSSKASIVTVKVGRGVIKGSVESSPRSTPSKRGASSVVETARYVFKGVGGKRRVTLSSI